MKTAFQFFKRFLRGDERGQVAIFIALIFQLLFLFFAMVINVGLLVHHKINLQNSADLAAYYGAMKQAEVLNAIGHVNYQIRQSYKLLTWRYRILGTSGVWPESDPKGGNPGHKTTTAATGIKGATILPGMDTDGYPRAPGALADFFERPDFCITFSPFADIAKEESTCQSPAGQTIAALSPAPVLATFLGSVHVANSMTYLANKAKTLKCENDGPFNYSNLARFIVAYNLDQGDRKRLIYKLANNLSKTTTDFMDISGDNASDGMKKTLEHNLTPANSVGLKDVKFFNSLAEGKCAQSTSGQTPPGWLSEVVIYPRASYKMCYTDTNASSVFTGKNIDDRPSKPPLGQPMNVGPEGDFKDAIDYLSSYIAIPDATNPDRPSLGVEKNPWCMAYVGVRVEAEPKIPFSLGTIQLKATAFAKPFGGRIGPWYGRTWQPGTMESTGNGPDQRTDARTPVRCVAGDLKNCAVQGTDAVTTINYSRFPGDPVGLASRMIQGQYTKSIYDLGSMSFAAWNDIEHSPQDRSGDWDLLAHGSDLPAQQMRKLEVAALVPDIFDLTYYSVDPDFYNNYYVGKLEKYVKNNPPASGYVIRGDLGSSLRGNNLSGGRPSAAFNIQDQMEVAANIPAGGVDSYGLDWNAKLSFALVDSINFAHLLTGWISKPDLSTYDFDPNRFGKCTTPALASVPVPGSCQMGGRTGYSVKIVASDALLQDQNLGGVGVSSAKIMNLPPDEFLK